MILRTRKGKKKRRAFAKAPHSSADERGLKILNCYIVTHTLSSLLLVVLLFSSSARWWWCSLSSEEQRKREAILCKTSPSCIKTSTRKSSSRNRNALSHHRGVRKAVRVRVARESVLHRCGVLHSSRSNAHHLIVKHN